MSREKTRPTESRQTTDRRGLLFGTSTLVAAATLDGIKDDRAKAGQRAQSIDKIRSGVNQMIEQQLQQRGVK
jgi:hypothetical protein